jgi:glycine/D-amino acid oxidase-like deaminating enzyme
MPSVGILNGFGTKGCTLAPYFGAQLADFLLTEKPLMPIVDVRRFTKILSR